jgi:thioredoxin reductase (NADPH)
MDLPKETDILIIGAGPIGIEVAAALKRNDFDYLHLEAGNIGSTIAWYSPGTPIFSSPDRLELAGVPFRLYPQMRATREDYLTYLRTVVVAYGLTIHSGRRVVEIRKRDDGRFECAVARSNHAVGGPQEHLRVALPAPTETVVCRRLILAIGDMHQPHEIGVPGERLPFVSHYFGEPHEYFRRKVVIIGAKNSAAEAAVRLNRVDADVTVCHRGADFHDRVKPWLLPELRLLIREGKMQFLPRVCVTEIVEGAVHLQQLDDGSRVSLPCDKVLLLTGYRQDTTLFEQLGIELTGPGKVPEFNAETMETSAKNVFVAGTAAAGTQLGGVTAFIETSHIHVGRIVRALGGKHSFAWAEAKVRNPLDREQ